jgi:hypothetical protein
MLKLASTAMTGIMVVGLVSVLPAIKADAGRIIAAATQPASIEDAAKTAPQQKQFGPDDISTMVEVYKNNPVRFQRDYAGKSFEAVMPYNPAATDPSFGTNQQYSSLPAVICIRYNDSDKAAIAEWNRNDRIRVHGIIMPAVSAGVALLVNCTFSTETTKN